MIVPGYSLTATERVLPRMALDFTTGVLDSRVTVTRALNTSTRVNSSGYIETVNADLPRFEYDPITKLPKGLLIEESRINLSPYSEDFSNGSWSKRSLNTTGTPAWVNTATAPNNTLTADKLIPNTVSDFHFVAGPATTGTGSHTMSVFAQAGEYTRIILREMNVTGAGAIFNLSNGTVVNTSGVTATITPYIDGSYRCTATMTWGTNYSFGVVCSTNNNTADLLPTFTGNGSDGVYVWGAQLEAGAFATSYIPNLSTGTTTRNADVATMTSTNFSSWWTATVGAAAAEILPSTVSGVRPAFQFDDNTADNIISLRGNTTNPELYIKATSDQAQIDAGAIAANTAYMLTGAWNTDNCAAAVNGGAAVPDTTATIPTVTQARLGSDGTNYLNGHLQTIRYWPQRLTNAELQAFSKL